MTDVKRSTDGSMLEIGDKIRIESGPVRRRGTATDKLLHNDVTAGHYQVGKPDALGKPIKMGEVMDYIDWKSEDRAWYVYVLDGVKQVTMKEGPDKGKVVSIPNWALKATCPSEEAALSEAFSLAAAK